MNNLLKIGSIQKTHGIKGELSCNIQIVPDDFVEVKCLFIKNNEQAIPYFIQKFSYNQQKLIVQFEEIDTVEKAKTLLNKDLWIDEKYVTEDEYLWVDQIMGFKIIDSIAGHIGDVENFYKIPNNDLLVTSINNNEVLIPANTHIVKKIDHKSKSITVELPEGLLDIYTSNSNQEPDDADEEDLND